MGIIGFMAHLEQGLIPRLHTDYPSMRPSRRLDSCSASTVPDGPLGRKVKGP